MQQLPKSLSDKLAQRDQTGTLRELPSALVQVDFTSNDYLGLSQNAAIYNAAHQHLTTKYEIANGATGSRLISGNYSLYEETENYIAQFHQAETALVFNSGYDANIGFFSSVPQKEDVILYDALIHASVRDGIRLSNALAYRFAHNDMEALQKMIERYRDKAHEIYVVTESVFSMDGDSPDMQLLMCCTNYKNVHLIIDEAHALGVMGSGGKGLVQHYGLENYVFARIITFGKGLGCHGAAVLGSKTLSEYLINFARSFIYTTGLPPHALATILQAYKHLKQEEANRNKLLKNIAFFREEARRLNLPFIPSTSAIHCIIIAGNEKVKHTAKQILQKGYEVKAILSPTVQAGQERLRFCLHSYNTAPQISGVLKVLKEALTA